MYSQHPEMAEEWSAHTPKGKKLPEHVKEKSATGAALKFLAQEVSQAAHRRAAKKKEADMIKVGQFNAFADELVKIKEAQVASMAAGTAQNMRGMAAQTGAGMMSGGARGMGGGSSMGGGAGSSFGGGIMSGLKSFGSSVQNMLSTGGRGRGGGAGIAAGSA